MVGCWGSMPYTCKPNPHLRDGSLPAERNDFTDISDVAGDQAPYPASDQALNPASNQTLDLELKKSGEILSAMATITRTSSDVDMLSSPIAKQSCIPAIRGINCSTGKAFSLEPDDVEVLIALSKCKAVGKASVSSDHEIKAKPPFISDLLWRRFVQHGCVQQLRRTYRQDWVASWDGWKEATSKLQQVGEDADASARIVQDCLQRFSTISLNKIVFTAKSDAERILELRRTGRRVGKGLVYNENACLADSLLQLLSLHGYLDRTLSGSSVCVCHEATPTCLRGSAEISVCAS